MCGIPEHFAKDCRRQETAQCRKLVAKAHLDRPYIIQGDRVKNESVLMFSTFATPDEEYWVALTQWKTASKLLDIGCPDHIMTNVNALLDFASFNQK